MRNSTLDVAKGIGIWLVLIGHGSWGAPTLFKYIYAFHMPLFFMLSGYFFKPRPFEDAVKKSFTRLIIPYLIIGFACAIPSIIFGHTASFSDFIQQAAGTLYSVPKSSWTFYCTPIWFLTCLFCTEIFYNLIARLRPAAAHFTVTAMMIAAIYVLKDGPIFLPWNAGIAFIGVFFFHIGAIAKTHNVFSVESSRQKHAMLIPLVAVVFIASVEASTTTVNLSAGLTGNLFTFIATSLSGSLLVMLLASTLREVKLLAFFGANTIILFGFNYWILKLGNTVAPKEWGWMASFAVQIPFYIGLAWISQNNEYVSRILKNTERKLV